MSNYLHHIKSLVKRLLLIFIFMTLTRLLFYFMNKGHFGHMNFSELFLHLVYGLRYDLVSIFLVNSLFVILSIVPGHLLNYRFYQRILKWIFIPVNLTIIAVNLVDCKFYEFQEKRLTADIFNSQWLGDDFRTMLPNFIADYWYLFLVFVAISIILIYVYPKSKTEKQPSAFGRTNLLYQSLIALLIIALTILACRGTFQLKPLRIITATQYTSPNRVPVILNSSFTIIKTFGQKRNHPVRYFTDEEATKIFNPLHQFYPNDSIVKKNVFIIILESFGREYSGFLNGTGRGYTPCLDSIMKQGLYCTNGFANGKRSIDAMPSIISSIPTVSDEPFITSSFTSNQIDGIASLLKPFGYQSAFFHGGKNGTMGFDNFAALSGFDKYYGLNEYPNPGDYDGNWGVPDEPFLNFVVSEVSTFKEPFVAGVFTLSSHHPYRIPEKYTGKFPKGTLVNHESIGYADYALGRFFQQAAKQAWFKNTLFVLTADHTAQTELPFFSTTVGHYAVPVVFYCPSDSLLKGACRQVAQQADILPSVLDYLHFPNRFIAYGNSIFNMDSDHFAIAYLNGLIQLIKDDKAILFDGNKITDAYTITSDSLYLVPNPEIDNSLIDNTNLIKAYIQLYYSRMMSNQMTIR